jgi:1,4-alpha-glucan branching enzyme
MFRTAYQNAVCIANLTEAPREVYRIGLPTKGDYMKIFDSEEERFFGSNYAEV